MRIALILAFVLALTGTARADEPRLGDDGLYHTDWFITSLLDLRDDHAEAAAAGKRLVIVWEQKGCSFCRKLHTVHLRDAKIVDYLKPRFAFLQLDTRGSRPVTDLDGETLEEGALAKKWGVRTTPTLQILGLDAKAALGKPVSKSETTRIPGLLEPADFMTVFRKAAEGVSADPARTPRP